jgi:peptidoglycan/xylan/chitin deacetylase (PgdA/CDA1 family)
MLETVIGATGAVLGGAGFMGYAVRGRSSHVFAPSVYRGVGSRPAVALTFDDGPSESTPALLEVLAEHNVRATFFMCGKNVRRCASVARQVAAQGHEIGNHTDSHPHLYLHLPEFVYRELAIAQETIHVKTGVTPRLFRAPYGVRTAFRAAEAQTVGRDVDRPRQGLAVAGAADLASAGKQRVQRRHHLPARRPRCPAIAGHPRHHRSRGFRDPGAQGAGLSI